MKLASCAWLVGVLVFIPYFTSEFTLFGQQPLAPSKPTIMPDQIHGFWSWFIENKTRFTNFEHNPDDPASEIVEHLRRLSRNLTIEVEVPKNGVREMAISADGVEDDFPLVQQLIKAAPSVEGWRFVAFRQAGKIEGMELNFPGITLDTDKMWIMPIEDDHGFDLIVFFPDYTDDKRSLFINGSYILLDNAIGEYNVVKGIRTLDFQKLPPANDRKGIVPFVDLPKVFAAYRANHHI